MNDEHLINLPPLCGNSTKPLTPISRNETIKLRFGASDLELPAFLRGNKALADHLHRVQIERAKVLARIEMDALAKCDAPGTSANAALLFSPMDYKHERLETVLSLDFTKAS